MRVEIPTGIGNFLLKGIGNQRCDALHSQKINKGDSGTVAAGCNAKIGWCHIALFYPVKNPPPYDAAFRLNSVITYYFYCHVESVFCINIFWENFSFRSLSFVRSSRFNGLN